METIFKTVLILSAHGFCLTAVLLALKPFTVKRLSARWQYCVWIVVLLSMVMPVYKLIPKQDAQRFMQLSRSEVVQPQRTERATEINESEPQPKDIPWQNQAESAQTMAHRPSARSVRFFYAACVWLLGVCVYLLVVTGSYGFYLFNKRKRSVAVAENAVFKAAKQALNIKRTIRIRLSDAFESPMLVGVVFPVIYLPRRNLSDEALRMVCLHELMHYKRKDLLIKWFSVLVNAVHWFNPLAYLMCGNIGEACEISCDMAVTKHMSDAEQKMYMKTILDLVE